MNEKAPGAYPTDMLSALMNETIDKAGKGEQAASPASLQREVALLRGILDQANVWLDVLDGDGNVVLWNEAAESISGYTREEVVGHGKIWDWLYPDPVYRQDIIEQAAAIINGEAVQDFETVIRTKDGEERVISWYSRDITNDAGEQIGSIALGRDITGRRQAERALEESEQRYRTIVENANDWIWTLDSDGRLTFANRAAQQATGYDLSEWKGKTFSSFIHPDDLPHVRDIFERTLQGAHHSYRVRILDSDGRTMHLQVTSAPCRSGDEIVGTIAFGRDVTEQVVLENKLQESEERYRAIVEQSHDAVAIIQDTNILFVNTRLCELTGYGREAYGDMNLSDLVHPDDRKHVQRMMQQRLNGEATPSTFQAKLRTKEGEVRHGEFSVATIFYGARTAVLASIRDVTERRRIEQQLMESEQRLRDLLDTTSDCIWEVDMEGKYTFVSGRVEDTLGYTPDELLGTSPFSLMHEGEAQRMRRLFMETAAACEPLVDVENRVVAKNGDEVILLTNAVPIIADDGSLAGYRGTDKDVTARRQAEREIQESEKRYRTLVENLQEGMGIVDPDENIVFANPAFCDIVGYARDDLREMNLRDLVPREEFQHILQETDKRKQGASSTYETVMQRRDGELRDIIVSATPLTGDSDEFQGTIGLIVDVTEQRQAEREAQRQQELSRLLLNATHDMGLLLDADGTILTLNEAMARSLGVEPEEVIGTDSSTYARPGVFDPDVYADRMEKVREVQRTGQPVQFEDRRQGRWFDSRFYPIFDDEGNVKQIAAFARDVTEQKRMEQELRRSEQKYRELLEHANSAILKMDTDGNVTYFNEFAEEFFGWSEEEILGKNVVGTIVPETERSGRELASIVDDIISSPDEYVTNENENTRRNGEIVWMAWTNKVIYDDDGEVDEILCIGTDITEHKKIDDELRAREKRYRDTVNLLPMPYGEFKPDGTAVLLNRTCLDLFQYTEEDLERGLNVMQVLHPEDRERAGANIQRVLQGEETAGFEYRFVKKDGTVFPCLVYSRPVQEAGDITGFKSVLIDITLRKKLERELRESEEQYSTLVERGNDGIMIVQDYKVTYCNQKLLEITGYAMEEIQDSSVLDYVGPAFTAVVKERYEKRMAGEDVPQMYELEIIGKDGRSIPVEVNASVITYRGEPADMAIVRDITERKQMEQNLKKNEEKFRSLAENATDGIYQVDENDAFVFVNDVYCKILGYTEEELLGKKYTMILFDKDIPAAKNITRNASEGKVQKGEFTLKTKKGDAVPVHFSMGPRLVGGNKCGFSGIIHDITKRKEAEKQIRMQQKLTRTLLDATHDAALLADVDGTILAVNEAMADAMDDDREAIIGSHMIDRIGREAYARRTPKVREVQRTKQPVQFMDEREGRIFSHRFYPVFDEEGKVHQVAVFSQDITERKRMEQELQESEERYRRLVEASPDSIIHVGLDGRILTANEQAAAVHGFATPEDMIGRDAFAYVAEEDRQRAQENMQRVLEEGLIENINYTFLREDGTPFLVELSVATIYDEEGNPTAFVGITRDVTEQKKMEQKLRESEERYRRLVEASPDSIIHVGLDGHIITANDKAAQIHGFASAEDMVGYDAAQFLQPEDRGRAREDIQRMMEEGQVENLEYTFLREDGSPFQGALSLAIVYDVKDKPSGIIGITRDITERKHMEQQLEESEEKFRRLTEQSFDGIYTHNWRGVFTYVSPAVRRIAGYEPEEVEGTFFGRYIRKRDLPRLLKAVVDLKRGRSVEGLRYSIKRKDGTFAMVEVNVSPVFKNGKSVGVQGNLRDVTERVRAEERYRRLVEASPELIAEVDKDGYFVTANPAMARSLGCSPGELAGRYGAEVMPEDVFQRRMASIRRAIKNNAIIERQDEHSGRWYHNLVVPLDIPGAGWHVQIISRDITQRKKTERALRESEEKFRSLFTHAPVGIVLVDIEGRPVMSNPAFLDMLGYSQEELASMRFPEFTHPDDVEKDLEMYREVQEGKRDEYTIEKRYVAKDGSVVWANLTVSVIRGEDGEPLWGIGLVEDVTERRQAEQEQRRQEQLAALGRIAAVVSHEVNTPLANIALAADCLASEHRLEDSEELETIHREVDHASRIVKQVLGFSRMEDIDIRKTDLAGVVSEAADAVSDTVPVDADIELSVAPCEILADEHHLYRAFVNLVKNAVLARDRDKDTHRVAIDMREENDEAVVTIADNGIGMDAEVTAQADEPFFTTRPPGEGTGLGLYIARWIVEQHGGTLSIESTPGIRTTVTVRLPLGRDNA